MVRASTIVRHQDRLERRLIEREADMQRSRSDRTPRRISPPSCWPPPCWPARRQPRVTTASVRGSVAAGATPTPGHRHRAQHRHRLYVDVPAGTGGSYVLTGLRPGLRYRRRRADPAGDRLGRSEPHPRPRHRGSRRGARGGDGGRRAGILVTGTRLAETRPPRSAPTSPTTRSRTFRRATAASSISPRSRPACRCCRPSSARPSAAPASAPTASQASAGPG